MNNIVVMANSRKFFKCPKFALSNEPLLCIILFGCFLIGACATTVVQKRDDPLIGRIFRTADKMEISYEQLLKRALLSDVIFLGENHDNADHHDIQYKIIKDLIARGKRLQLGFEFFSIDQTSRLMAYASITGMMPAGHERSAELREKMLRDELGWDKRPDKTWEFYFRFVKLAQKRRLKIFGADLPKGIIRRITRDGLEALTGVEKGLVADTGFQDEAYRKLMFGKFKAAHCGFGHQEFLTRMYQTWIARNDRMALSIVEMINQNPDEPVVMILGGGHTEHNMGVFERVSRLKPGIRQLNIRFQEIAIEPTPRDDYFKPASIDKKIFAPPHEFLWFTQRTSYEDPCRRFRKQLRLMKNRNEK